MLDAILLSYRMEYETTDISLPELKVKYKLTESDIKGNETWEKSYLKPTKTSIPTNSTKTNISTNSIQDNIEIFKEKALKEALAFLATAITMDTKEFKDMVTIVDTIEKSYVKAPTAPTINILVQNLTEKYKDDC